MLLLLAKLPPKPISGKLFAKPTKKIKIKLKATPSIKILLPTVSKILASGLKFLTFSSLGVAVRDCLAPYFCPQEVQNNPSTSLPQLAQKALPVPVLTPHFKQIA